MSRRMRPSEPAGRAPRAGVFLLALLIVPAWLLAQQVSGTRESLAQNAKPPQKEGNLRNHTEYAVKNKVLMEYVKYQLNEARLQPNWASEAKKMAGANKLIRWRELFDSDLVAWTPAHHVTAFATVSFLMRTDAVRFAKFNLLIREGATADEALEKIYGRPIDRPEAMCGKWILQGA